MDTREIQTRLIKLGYSCGPTGADGILGRKVPESNTRKAVRTFQRDNPPLIVDGEPGVQTQTRLRALTDVGPGGGTAPIMTADKLLRAFPHARPDILAAFAKLKDEIATAGLTTGQRCAHFLAQIGAETGGLTTLEESFAYSPSRLRAVFPSRVTSDAQAEALVAAGPEAIANFLYGGRYGNTHPGDGWKYRGGGALQTTFFDNYEAIGHADDPETVRTPEGGLRAALNYWQSHGCNAIADKDQTEALRRVINGGDNGLDLVLARLPTLKGIFGGAAAAAPRETLAARPALQQAIPAAPRRESTFSAAHLFMWALLVVLAAAVAWWYFAGRAHAQALAAPSAGVSMPALVQDVLYPLALAAVPLVAGWFGWMQHKITHKTMEAADRDALQTALRNAAGLGSRWLGDAVHTTTFDVGNPLVDELVNQVVASVPDALKRFGLDGQDATSRQLIATKIEAHLPQIAAPTPSPAAMLPVDAIPGELILGASGQATLGPADAAPAQIIIDADKP